jgi:hypothetical protein
MMMLAEPLEFNMPRVQQMDRLLGQQPKGITLDRQIDDTIELGGFRIRQLLDHEVAVVRHRAPHSESRRLPVVDGSLVFVPTRQLLEAGALNPDVAPEPSRR